MASFIYPRRRQKYGIRSFSADCTNNADSRQPRIASLVPVQGKQEISILYISMLLRIYMHRASYIDTPCSAYRCTSFHL